MFPFALILLILAAVLLFLSAIQVQSPRVVLRELAFACLVLAYVALHWKDLVSHV